MTSAAIFRDLRDRVQAMATLLHDDPRIKRVDIEVLARDHGDTKRCRVVLAGDRLSIHCGMALLYRGQVSGFWALGDRPRHHRKRAA